MLDGCVVFPVVGDGLVKGNVFVVGDFVGLAHPDGLQTVQVFPFVADFLDLLGLLLLLGFFLVVDFFDLWLVVVAIFFVIIFVIIVGDFLLGGLLGVQHDGESNEFGVLLDQILDALFFKVFGHVFLQVEDDTGSSLDSRIFGIGDSERTSGFGNPCVDGVIVVLGYNFDLVGNQVGRVETDTELSNHGNIGSGGEGLHESLGSGFGNGSEVVDQVGLGHTNTGIFDGEGVVSLVGDELDLQFGIGIQDGGVRQGLVANLIQGIGGIGDQFTKENFLVGVKGVDNQRKELVDISGEGVALGFGSHFGCCI
mmetsp:Transcript_18346/g.42100  ORF Transcript_18346/g.42100 Transcript_18346/m.42100 type:complete len:310 (-) Transcript_18346:113-1042(-)